MCKFVGIFSVPWRLWYFWLYFHWYFFSEAAPRNSNILKRLKVCRGRKGGLAAGTTFQILREEGSAGEPPRTLKEDVGDVGGDWPLAATHIFIEIFFFEIWLIFVFSLVFFLSLAWNSEYTMHLQQSGKCKEIFFLVFILWPYQISESSFICSIFSSHVCVNILIFFLKPSV